MLLPDPKVDSHKVQTPDSKTGEGSLTVPKSPSYSGVVSRLWIVLEQDRRGPRAPPSAGGEWSLKLHREE